MAEFVEQVIKCLLVICKSSIQKSLFRSVPHFLIREFGNLLSSFLSSLYTLEISPLSDVGLIKIFLFSVGCCFVLVIILLPYRNFSVSGGTIF